MDSARKFVDKGQIDKAVKEYLRIVQEDPKDVRVWLKIGDLYVKQGAKQDATDTYLKVATYYHDQGFLDKAIAVYQQILKLDPRLVDVILKLADLYRQRGKMVEAMQHFESVAAHFHREGNTKEALETVKKLVDLDPENISTRIKLAELYSKEGLIEEAVQQFTLACEQLRRQNRQDDFVKVAERLLWHKPDNHALNRELAGLYLRRNDPRRALQKLQACFKADPRDVETLGLLAQAFQALDQKAKTVSVLKELARIHIENKGKDKAGEVYRKILEFVPNDAEAMQFLGLGPAQPQPSAPSAHAPPPGPQPVPPQFAPPPQPMAAAPPPSPHTPRPSTLPAAVRAADPRFVLTGDVPSIPPAGMGTPASSRMTGSMPLVDESALLGNDFTLPEYDDADFSADMEPPPDPRYASANGERHSEEISKILAETDVYVKYGLHQKAVDHLRRIFALDGENVEAHERLKDIFISQGREQEAEGELLKLAELVASGDPDRAEAYLQELLAMNGTHTGAFDLARKFRLRVARMSSVSSEVEYAGGGGVVTSDPDIELDELDLVSPPRAPASSAMGVARSTQPARRGPGGREQRDQIDSIDSIDDFDPNELIGSSAQGSPPPARPPGPPAAVVTPPKMATRPGVGPSAGARPTASPANGSPAVAPARGQVQAHDDAFDLDFEPSGTSPESSLQMPSTPVPRAPVHAQTHAPADYRDDATYSGSAFETIASHEPRLDDAVDAQLDDAALGEDIDQQVAAELGAGDDMPFDPEAARAFDAYVERDAGGQYLTGYEETQLPRRSAQRDSVVAFDDLADGGGEHPFDSDGTEAALSPAGEATAAHSFGQVAGGEDTSNGEQALGHSHPRADSGGVGAIEDELETADFYIGQGMYNEAIDVLHDLRSRYPNQRLVLAKLREVQALASETSIPESGEHGAAPEHHAHHAHHGHDDHEQLEAADDDDLGDPIEVVSSDGTESSGEVVVGDAIDGTDALELEDLDELAPSEPVHATPRAATSSPRLPQVTLERPVEENDAETHYDLGLAYKEMGLYDEAVKAFDMTLRVPAREVRGRLMIGMCHREQGKSHEAIHQFKQALHSELLSDAERQSLYYEIGQTYEEMNDPSEALYYFDLVIKRDPRFADAASRADALRSRASRSQRHAD